LEVAIKSGQEGIKTTVRASQEGMKATVRASQEKLEAVINSIWSQLKETIINWVEDFLSSVNQNKQSLHEDMADTKKELHEADMHSSME
jgi:hypothetical protein